jgi:hypothetical protein
VNEFKQVIKPVSQRSNEVVPYYVGGFPNLKFTFRWAGALRDPSRSDGLRVGDLCPYPPCGMLYHIGMDGRIFRVIRERGL